MSYMVRIVSHARAHTRRWIVWRVYMMQTAERETAFNAEYKHKRDARQACDKAHHFQARKALPPTLSPHVSIPPSIPPFPFSAQVQHALILNPYFHLFRSSLSRDTSARLAVLETRFPFRAQVFRHFFYRHDATYHVLRRACTDNNTPHKLFSAAKSSLVQPARPVRLLFQHFL